MEEIIYGILAFAIVVLLGGLVFWGLGNLFILVFKIDYTWTYLHGIVCQLIYMVIKEINE